MQYVVPVWQTLFQAWEKTSGSKYVIWQSTIAILILTLGFSVLNALFTLHTPSLYFLIHSLIQVLANLLVIGLVAIGIRHALNQPISVQCLFEPLKLPTLGKLIVLYLLQALIYMVLGLISVIGYFISRSALAHAFLFALPFYLIATVLTVFMSVRLALALAFVLDKKMNGWEAIKASYRVTQGNFFNLIIFFFFQVAIVVISAIPLFIGLIWTFPFLLVSYGVIYRKLLVNLGS
jgi:uncharacterized membrane protein